MGGAGKGVRYLTNEDVEAVEVRGRSAEQALRRLGRYVDQFDSFRLVGLDMRSGSSDHVQEFVLASDPEVILYASFTV